MTVSIEYDTDYKGTRTLTLKTDGAGHDVRIDLDQEGNIEIEQDGHGGYQCCSYHATRFQLSRTEMTELRNFLTEVLGI